MIIMASGGARNRSGPAPDPMSGRSDRRGLVFTALPREGYRGEAPKFPLMRRVVLVWGFNDEGAKQQVVDSELTELIAEREAELWQWAWRTPQAAAWSQPGQEWRWHSVAMWVRTAVICESSEATAADKNSLHRFADQIGLTPAGLAENGWAIAKDEVGEKRTECAATVATDEPAPKSARDRLRAIGNA